MSLIQLLNVLVFLLFLGILSSYVAKKRGRDPLIWFAITFFLGLLAMALLFILPKVKKAEPQRTTSKPVLARRSDAWLKMWYYLDGHHASQGPFEFPEFIKKLKEETMTVNSYVWGEGMKEWRPLSDLPEVLREIEQG